MKAVGGTETEAVPTSSSKPMSDSPSVPPPPAAAAVSSRQEDTVDCSEGEESDRTTDLPDDDSILNSTQETLNSSAANYDDDVE